MQAFTLEELPIAIDTGNTQIRARVLGHMTILFYRFRRGSDLRSHLEGLPGDRCTCPHWGLVLKGKLRIHTVDGGASDVVAGQAFYVEPGHIPEALEDTEMFEVSPTKEVFIVGEHLRRKISEDHPAP